MFNAMQGVGSIRAFRAVRFAGILTALTLAFAPASQSQSDPGYDWAVTNARVLSIELTYMPGMIPFVIDSNAGSCATGTWLKYESSQSDTSARIANMKSVLAALMTAKVSNTPIRIYGRSSGCTISFIYFG